jgi:DNA-binding transcriptional MerR regulator
MKIGELAARAHTQIETIRYYERADLLEKPVRSESNYRVYGDAHVERLSFIRHCRGLDMTLAEIRVLDKHIGHVAERVKELRSLEKQLKQLRLACRGTHDAEHCGILNEINAIAKGPTAPLSRTGHLKGAHNRNVAPGG